jgi:hypothetical protein
MDRRMQERIAAGFEDLRRELELRVNPPLVLEPNPLLDDLPFVDLDTPGMLQDMPVVPMPKWKWKKVNRKPRWWRRA